MSHDITNASEALYANRPAWHGLGYTFAPGGSEGMTTADVERLAPSIFAERTLLPLAGWRSGAAPNMSDQFQMFGPSDMVDGGSLRLIARLDGENTRVHGIARKGYRIWQVREAFAFLDSLVSEGSLQYESVFALAGGDHVVMACRLPGRFTLGRNDTTIQYVMVKVPFTGTDAITMCPTWVRVVCANTVAMAVREASRTAKAGEPVIFRLRHSANLDDRLAEAKAHLAKFDASLQVEASDAERLAGRTIARSEAEAFIADMFPATDSDGEPLKGRKATERERKVSVLRESWATERDTFRAIGEASMVGSAWHLLQAVTRAADHGGLSRTRGDARKRAEAQYTSSLEGPNATLKARARTQLLALAGV